LANWAAVRGAADGGGVLGAAVVAGGGVGDGVGVLDDVEGEAELLVDPSEQPATSNATAAHRQAEARKRLGMEQASWSWT
jgi:hypothetical protein